MSQFADFFEHVDFEQDAYRYREEWLSKWEPYKDFQQVMQDHDVARVYICAVDCSGRVGKRELRKFEKFAEKHQGLRVIEVEEYSYQSKKTHYRPAIATLIKDWKSFEKLWGELAKIANSSCGCSAIINDGQGIDVRIMDSNHFASDDKAGIYGRVKDEVYQG